MEHEAINQKYQVKKYPCGVDKFRTVKGSMDKTISYARNKKT
jgi:hypothetical protein